MIFVFDLDGTICFHGKPINQIITTALKTLQENGHQVIFASARPIRDMLPVIPDAFHKEILIGGNGSLIAENKQVIFSQSFSPLIVEHLLHLIDEHEATYLIDGEWDYAYTGADNHPILQNVDPGMLANKVGLNDLSSIVKVLLLSYSKGEILLEKLKNLQVTVHFHRNENVIDKFSALLRMGIHKEDYIAFSNDANDISMFQHAQHAVMIGYHQDLSTYASEHCRKSSIQLLLRKFTR